MRFSLCAALLCSVLSCAAPASQVAASTQEEVPAVVTRVVDGDTVHVDLGGDDVTIRLIGIDTPEVHSPTEPVQCYGAEATRYTTERLEGERVSLVFDVEHLDRCGRTLAYVFIGDELFNETLVREGYAVVTTYPPNVSHVDSFVAAQRDAREHARGLWSACP